MGAGFGKKNAIWKVCKRGKHESGKVMLNPRDVEKINASEGDEITVTKDDVEFPATMVSLEDVELGDALISGEDMDNYKISEGEDVCLMTEKAERE